MLTTSTETDMLFAALAAAKKAFKPVIKNNLNPHFKSRFADLSAINEATQEALHTHGLTVIQYLASAEGGIGVGARLTHASGQWLDIAPAFIPSSKPDAQGVGSAATYGRRYQIAALLNLAAEDDDDGNLASKPGKESPADVAKRVKAIKKVENNDSFL